MTEHEKWLKKQVDEALDKAERGESVYYTKEQAKQKMNKFKNDLATKSKK